MGEHRPFGATRKLPSGRWQASYVGPDGLRHAAPGTFANRGDARAWLALRQAEIIRSDWMDPELGRVSLGDFGWRWIREHRLRERTREAYASVFRLHIEPQLGDVAIGRVTPEVVRAWRMGLLAEGRSEDLAAKAYRLLRAILNTAVDDGRVRRNPRRLKGADTASRAERPVATVAQVYRLAEEIGDRFRVFILTAGLTGMRWGELIALRRSDIDLQTGLVSVHRTFARCLAVDWWMGRRSQPRE